MTGTPRASDETASALADLGAIDGRAERLRAWARLCSPEQRTPDDLAWLQCQLDAWRQAHGDIDAALYVHDGVDEDGDAFRRVASGGSCSFPPCMSGEIDDAWRMIELPAGLLLTARNDSVETALDFDPAGDDLFLLAAGAHIAGLKSRLQEYHFQARFRGVEVEALYDVGLAITSSLDLDAVGDEVLLRAVSLLDARRGALYLLEDEQYRLRSCFGGDAGAALEVADPGIAKLLAGTGAPAGLMPGAEFLLAVPIEIDGARRGMLVAADKESRRGIGPFPAPDRRTLSLFANQAGIALENAKLHRLALEKERLEREMELAAEIQNQLLPKSMPTIDGYEVLGWNRPARQVGGDYFDLRGLADHRWSMVVGDVTGKGMPAALLVSTLHSALRLLPDTMAIGPALVERLNTHVFDASASNKFITMLLAELDDRDGTLTYLNAGHNPGLLVRADGRVEQLPAGGLPLGLMLDVTFEARELKIEPGDLVCFYSDGITECESPEEEQLGEDRLIALLRSHAEASLAHLVAAIDRAVLDFARGRPQGDDQTVVLLRRQA